MSSRDQFITIIIGNILKGKIEIQRLVEINHFTFCQSLNGECEYGFGDRSGFKQCQVVYLFTSHCIGYTISFMINDLPVPDQSKRNTGNAVIFLIGLYEMIYLAAVRSRKIE